MRLLNKMSALVVLFAGLFAFTNLNAAASVVVNEPTTLTSFEDDGIKIKIVIVITIGKKKKGFMQGTLSAIRMAKPGERLGENEIAAMGSIEGNRLVIDSKMLRANHLQLAIPRGFKVEQRASLKMGAKGALTLKAGRIEKKPSQLLQFEIQ